MAARAITATRQERNNSQKSPTAINKLINSARPRPVTESWTAVAGRNTVVSSWTPVRPGSISFSAASMSSVTCTALVPGNFSMTSIRPASCPTTASPIRG